MPISQNQILDFHNHNQRHAGVDDITEIVSLHLGQDKPHELFTVGLHPWWTEQLVSPTERAELMQLLAKPNCIAMGEMGLDNLKGPAMATQMDVLRSQLEIATEVNKPVIIHCVRAFDQLIQVKKEFPSVKNWCVHGYGRHAILANQLVDQGFYLSIMPTSAKRYQEIFDKVPNNRLFLETDSMPNTSIKVIYLQVAELTGLGLKALKRQIIENANTFF